MQQQQNVIRTIRTLIPHESSSVTRGEIEHAVDQVLQMPIYEDYSRDYLINQVEALYKVRSEEYKVIEKEERHLPWLSERKPDIEWKFWSRYRDLLEVEKNFPPEEVNKLDRLTDRILDGFFDPTDKIEVDKRGLVVGQVQSGKTANYTGLICKAADAGFKLIVVLAGVHNNLRSQTQLRIDEGFLGFDTQHTRDSNQSNLRIGVGNISSNEIAHSLTSSMNTGDFKQSAANSLGINFDTDDPIIAVIKKNPSVLSRLHQWLIAQAPEDSQQQRLIKDKSLLLIDDEADHASINVSNEPGRRSRINGLITGIKGLFGKSAYVGYTATPFANVFIPINENDIFPRDFIINIPPPSNHIGPSKVFGFEPEEENDERTALPIVNRVDDYKDIIPDKHKKNDTLPSTLPDSLKLAIRCFILTCAVRRARGQTSVHNSMLVHVSRFRRWQDQITELIQNQFDYYKMGIEQHDKEIIELFRSTFERDYDDYMSYPTISNQILQSQLSELDPAIQVHSWKEVYSNLTDAVLRIHVRAIHGGSGDALNYYDHKEGLSVIAVGGDKLSRGLTLEGLSVSYFLRSSKMYDTLMQMGRWFGYRPGYVDLCRLFTSRELNEWFCHITRASEELREEFDYMADVAKSTPEQYAVSVKTHPGVLKISATNKLKTAVTVNISHAGRLVESYELKKEKDAILSNFQNVKSLVSNLPVESVKRSGNHYLWYNRSVDEVINFLHGFKSVENLRAYNPTNLIQFIRKQIPNEELTKWRIALMSKDNASKVVSMPIGNESRQIGCFVRKEEKDNSSYDLYYLKKSHIISPKHEFIDLTDEDYNKAKRLTREQKGKAEDPSYPTGEIVRNQIRDPKNPLLLIYLLDPYESLEHYPLPEHDIPFVGYAISFPYSNFSSSVSYAVNEQLLEKFDFDDDELDNPNDDED